MFRGRYAPGSLLLLPVLGLINPGEPRGGGGKHEELAQV